MWFLEQIAASVIGCIVGVVFPYIVFHAYTKRRFSGWKVVVKDKDAIRAERKVGPKKAEIILEDDAELSVFVKGIVSPFCTLNEDLLSERARDIGLFTRSDREKRLTVDISRNPSKT